MHPVICSYENSVTLTTLTDVAYIFDLLSGKPPQEVKSTALQGKKVDTEAKGVILYAAYSQSGMYLALCNDYKQLYLYDVKSGKDWKLMSVRNTPKKGAKIVFRQDDSCLLMADKFGDVTSFSVTEAEKEGEIILGHLSMLLDCTFLLGDRFIATADRDEKIRVSVYPNTYEIQSFCLSHTKYVTSLIEADDWLVSGGGDGVIKLWNPVTGEMISEVVCSDDSKVIQQLIYIPETKTIVCLLNSSTELVYISLSGEGKAVKLDTEVTTYELPACAITMCRVSGGVLVLVDKQSNALQFIPTNTSDDVSVNLQAVNEHIQSNWDSFDVALKSQTDFFANLTKLNSDNMEEEMERKGKRPPITSEKNGAPKVAKVVT